MTHPLSLCSEIFLFLEIFFFLSKIAISKLALKVFLCSNQSGLGRSDFISAAIWLARLLMMQTVS